MTPEQFGELKDALAPKASGNGKRIMTWLGIAGGIVAVFVALWQFGDGLFFTDAEAADERATRVFSESLIETEHGQDIRDIIAIDSAQQTSIELIQQEQQHAKEARARLEKRVDWIQRRSHE